MAALELPETPRLFEAEAIPPRVVPQDPDQTGSWWPPAVLLESNTLGPAHEAVSVAHDWALDAPTGQTIDLFGPQELTDLEEDDPLFAEAEASTLIEGLPSGITLPPLPVIRSSTPVPAEVLVRKNRNSSNHLPTEQIIELKRPQRTLWQVVRGWWMALWGRR
ncbi:MAG: hypothetical protein ACE366_31620 [Bradymonadia bacterium]